MSKKEIRKNIIELRKSFSEEELREKSRNIQENLLDFLKASGLYEKADSYFSYYPMKREVDIKPVCNELLKEGKTVYFPLTHKDMSMDFYSVPSMNLENFHEGMKGIMEPNTDFPRYEFSHPENSYNVISSGNVFIYQKNPVNPLIIITPGLAFAEDGGRIGYGGGCYDRFFERLDKAGIYYIKIGLCFSEQIFDNSSIFCLDENDRKMDYILTDRKTDCFVEDRKNDCLVTDRKTDCFVTDTNKDNIVTDTKVDNIAIDRKETGCIKCQK